MDTNSKIFPFSLQTTLADEGVSTKANICSWACDFWHNVIRFDNHVSSFWSVLWLKNVHVRKEKGDPVDLQWVFNLLFTYHL